MAKKITPFFATETDLTQVFAKVMATRFLKFVIAGLFDTPDVKSAFALVNADPKANYLLADHDTVIEIRKVPQRKGGEKFAIDQLVNPKTIVLRAGGIINGNCLLAGQVGTISESPISLEIYKVVVSEIRKQFIHVKDYYVGEEAYKLLKMGARLTANPNAPTSYDLKIEPTDMA
jgi:hypothetical protein